MKFRRALCAVATSVFVLLAKLEDVGARLDEAEVERQELRERVAELEAFVFLERETLGEECGVCGEPLELCYHHGEPPR